MVQRRSRADSLKEQYSRVKVKPFTLVVFTRQLSIMLRNGVPVTYALDTLSHQDESPNFGEVVIGVARLMEEGHRMSHALSLFPKIFDASYISMVAIGEQTGALDSSLEKLANWRERDFDVTRKVKGALTYPCFVLGLAVCMTFFLFYSILPSFFDIFREMDVPLPWITRFLIFLTDIMMNPGWWLMATVFTVYVVASIREMMKRPVGARRIFYFLYSIPFVGNLLKAATVARFAAAVTTMVDSGLELTKSFTLAGKASGSPLVEMVVDRVVQGIREGETLAEHFLNAPDIFPFAFGQFVVVGEETSRISTMMMKAANLYDEEVNYKIEALGAALEPILLFTVATGVGAVLLATFLPLYGYINSLGL